MARLIELECVFSPCLCRCKFPAGAPVSPTIIKHMYNINIQSVPSAKCTNKVLVSENAAQMLRTYFTVQSYVYVSSKVFFFYNKAVETSCQAECLLF